MAVGWSLMVQAQVHLVQATDWTQFYFMSSSSLVNACNMRSQNQCTESTI